MWNAFYWYWAEWNSKQNKTSKLQLKTGQPMQQPVQRCSLISKAKNHYRSKSGYLWLRWWHSQLGCEGIRNISEYIMQNYN